MTYYDKIQALSNNDNPVIKKSALTAVKASEALRDGKMTMEQFVDILNDIKNDQSFIDLAEDAATKKMLAYLIDQAISLGPQVFTL